MHHQQRALHSPQLNSFRPAECNMPTDVVVVHTWKPAIFLAPAGNQLLWFQTNLLWAKMLWMVQNKVHKLEQNPLYAGEKTVTKVAKKSLDDSQREAKQKWSPFISFLLLLILFTSSQSFSSSYVALHYLLFDSKTDSSLSHFLSFSDFSYSKCVCAFFGKIQIPRGWKVRKVIMKVFWQSTGSLAFFRTESRCQHLWKSLKWVASVCLDWYISLVNIWQL